MKPFSERIKSNGQVMIAGLIDIKTKVELDKIAKATRRSKSGIMDIALRQWLHKERARIKDDIAEVMV